MREKPRPLGSKIFAGFDLIRSLGEGAVILAAALILLWCYHSSLSPETLRTMIFLQLILSNIGLIVADFSGGSPLQTARLLFQRSHLLMFIGILTVVTLLFLWPPLRQLFHMEILPFPLACIAMFTAFTTATLQGLWNWKVSRA